MQVHARKSGDGLVAGVIIVLALVLQGCATISHRPDFTQVQGYGDVIQFLDSHIKKTMTRNGIIALSIALVDGREIVWARGFGYADLENRIPATKNTIYRIGSISKLFTATAVMQLAQAEVIDIDVPFDTYVPEFSIRSRFENSSAITPRNIMTHHSGLPSDCISGMLRRNPETMDQFIPRLKDEYTSFPPGLIFSYSNLGMGLMGHMVEKVSETRFEDYMRVSVLGPIGMHHSSFVLERDLEGLYAKGYYQEKEQEQFLLRDMAAGSMYSSVVDLSRFLQMVFADGMAGENRILERETLSEMLSVQNKGIPLDIDLQVGLNWMIAEKKGMGTVIGHNGGITTFFSTMAAVPEEKLGVIVLTNCAEGSIAIAEICELALDALFEAKTGRAVPAPAKPEDKIVLASDELERCQGYYDTQLGFMTIAPKGERLLARIRDGSFVFTPRKDGTFTVKYLLWGFIPVEIPVFEDMAVAFRDIGGNRVLTVVKDGLHGFMGVRIDPVAIPSAWRDRLGRFENTGNEEEGISIKAIELYLEHGFLLADVTLVTLEENIFTVALQGINDSEAVVMALGRNRGNTFTVTGNPEDPVLHAYGCDFKPAQHL